LSTSDNESGQSKSILARTHDSYVLGDHHAAQEEIKMPEVPDIMHEGSEDEEAWLLSLEKHDFFKVNDIDLLAEGESKAFTEKIFLKVLSETVGTG